MNYLLSKTKSLSQYPYKLWATGPCFYCERETYRSDKQFDWAFSADHVVPRIKLRGYVRSRFHLPTVTCCYRCNHDKGSLTVKAFMDKHHAHRQKPVEWWAFVRRIESKCVKELQRANSRVHLPEARAVRDHHLQDCATRHLGLRTHCLV